MKNISFDIAALFLLIVLISSCYVRKMTRGISNHLFLILTMNTIASTIFDIAAVSLDNAQSSNIMALYTAHLGYLLTHFLSAPLYLLFIISLTDVWHKLRKNIIHQIMLIMPLAVMIGALIANAVNQRVFSVENGYKRGPLFILMYAGTLLYVVFAIICIIQYHGLLGRTKIMTTSTFVPLELVAMLVQMVHPTARVEMYGGAIGLLIISIGIQRPEDYIDSFTQLLKYSAYVYDMKRNSCNDKHVKIIMLNIGNFQSIQAMIGFDSAMKVLKEVSNKLCEVNRKMRGYADVYYLDNGRFRMVFLERYYDRAEGIAEVINQELKKEININGLEINLTPYIVVANYPEEFMNFRRLMAFGADFHQRSIYTGRIMRASEMYNQNQLDIQNNIDAIIERALENESFEVYYQPIYSIPQNKFVSAEALIRLFDQEHGFISPELLITTAERNGTIHRIGEFVFEKVCRFIASDEFKELDLEYIEVNLSVAQIMNGDLPENYLAIMKKYGVSPDKINLEITETAAAYAQKVMTDNIEELTQAGISFSLDDYGTGYSNMQRMIQLPLKIIKLDKSFVNEENSPKVWVFLKNTVKMLKDMDMEIVIEGVETQKMLEAFSNLQCDFVQGYFFSKPIPQNDFVAFISKAKNIL
ncbi:MAG: EAL domain-containing protein [Lachnospiraceae bacterium]|nr:EAL domain-containing protein [Lachnospiraceae bacterium]